MSLRSALKFFLVFFAALTLLAPTAALAQAPAGATVRGLIADPDDAVIPGATITLTPASGKAVTGTSGTDGTYTLHGIAPGTYSMTVTMQGFASFVRMGVRVAAGATLTVDAKMAIQTEQQVVQVSTNSTQLSVDSDSNASSTVLKGADLDALSDDPDELSAELSALAGPTAGPNGGQIYIDGFTGGQLPPKSSIREIRINQNPFSAQFDRLGFGRIEILTKPGTDKFHGSVQLQGNSSAFNTGNPFVSTQPPYHTLFFLGNLTGPINSKASFTLSGSRRQNDSNTLINAVIYQDPANPGVLCPPGPSLTCVADPNNPYVAAVVSPSLRWDISPRFDFALSEKNTLTSRFQYENSSHTTNGGGTALQSTGSTTTGSESTIQISDTQVVSSRVINETRFEYQVEKTGSTPNSTAPAVSVSGTFSGGGSASGPSSDRTTHIEVQNYTSVQLQKNFIRLGGRVRYNRDDNHTAGTSGSFNYNCVLISGCPADPASGAFFSYQGGLANQFSQTIVNHSVAASVTDLGLYAEDDWKVKPNLTFSYGLRYEVQNHINSKSDFAPRLSFAYGLKTSKGAPKTVLRGGFGIFYDRFNINNVIVPQQQNGVNQVRTIIKNPGLTCTPSAVNACHAVASGNTTTVTSPKLRNPYTLQFAFGFDQQLFRTATVSVNYLRAQGVHQYNGQNINAPIPGGGGYPLQPGLPVPSTSAIVQNQYQSEGIFNQNQLNANFNVRPAKFVTLTGFYSMNFADADTSGFGSNPTVAYNLRNDYGRASFDIRSRYTVVGNFTLPHLISLSPFVTGQSGNPYNVTAGTDLNNDSFFNDRPTFLSGQSSASCTNALSFNRTPTGNYTPIPINYCTGPSLFVANVRVAKTWGFGPAAGDRARRGGGGGGGGGCGGGPGAPGGPGGGGARGGGGGGAPRGGGGFGGASSGKRYNLNFNAQIQNLFNTTNYATPTGSLTSPLFGKTTQLAGMPYSSGSAKMKTTFGLSFTF